MEHNHWDEIFMNCSHGTRDGHLFLIVDSTDTPKDPNFFNAMREVLGLATNENDAAYIDDMHLDWNYWGYSDSFDVCSGCQQVIETGPSSGMPDVHWIDERRGEILCKECMIDEIDDYVEYVVSRNGKPHLWRLGEELLARAEFVKVLTGLENGLHEHQNDDPRALRTWARQHGLEAIFVLEADSQFDIRFGLWLRHEANDDGDCLPLTGTEYEEVREALLVNKDDQYSSLRYEYGQWPTPAENAMAMLRGQ